MNHQSSTAPQRSFLICASATTKGGTIKAMNYTPGDLALTEVRQSVESVLAAIDSMKQSILARAFHGELGA